MELQNPTPGNTYVIQSKATGFQLGVAGRDEPHENKRDPHVMVKRPGEGAVWEVEAVDLGVRLKTGGPFAWADEHAGGSIPHVGALDSNAERQVYVHQPNDGAYQKWRLLPDGEGYWQLVNVATGFALDGNQEDVYTMQPNDGAYQRWGFYAAAPS